MKINFLKAKIHGRADKCENIHCRPNHEKKKPRATQPLLHNFRTGVPKIRRASQHLTTGFTCGAAPANHFIASKQSLLFVLQAQAGWSHHDYGHQSVFNNLKVNNLMHQIVICLIKVGLRGGGAGADEEKEEWIGLWLIISGQQGGISRKC